MSFLNYHDGAFFGDKTETGTAVGSVKIEDVQCPICKTSTCSLVKNTVQNKIVGCSWCISFVYTEEYNV